MIIKIYRFCFFLKDLKIIFLMLSTQGEATKVKGMKDLTMYTYMSDTRATIVVDNKVRDKKQMSIHSLNYR